MSKWTLLLLAVISTILVVVFFRSHETIRRTKTHDSDMAEKLRHLPEAERHDRLDFAKMYFPRKAVVAAIAAAVYFTWETIKAFTR